jgi:predicted AlkP superfamily phosphohydrolase/phosphomutase
MKKAGLIIVALLVLLGAAVFAYTKKEGSGEQLSQNDSSLKMYWFIPDGMRAEPDVFNVYQWAREGKLPNIKKLMDRGTYGYSKPTFPGHTPTNFATLLTGSYPEVHGVDDGPMHVEGKPLNAVAVAGFRSAAKKVDPIWKTLEEQGETVSLLAIPGSTPPEINKGVVLRGRWGGWGADFHALNFETKADLAQRVKQGRASRLFFFGPQLTNYLDQQPAQGWENPPQSFSPAFETTLEGWGAKVFAYVYDATDDATMNYDTVAFSLDKKAIFSTLQQGEWGGWQPVTLKWATADKTVDVASDLRAHIIKLDDSGFFRFRIFYNNLNREIAQPAEAADTMKQAVGPMMDFVDNYPPQLVYYPEDKQTFLDEMGMTFDWHTNAISALVGAYKPTVVIHDIYNPNQMLTSRWWMGYVDPRSNHYDQVSEEERQQLWEEVGQMYQRLDQMVGEVIKQADEDTYIVLSSDHGAVPLDTWVHLNNVFAKKGWLKFKTDPKTGEPIIDWAGSRVMYIKMDNIYINPNGLAGDYKRATGPEYEKLREEVRATIQELKTEDGQPIATDIVNWEDAKEFMKLDPERVGDLVVANQPGYGWNEEMSEDLKVFSEPLSSGYKQAIDGRNVPGMWTPFVIAGPGIKKNNYLGPEPIDHIDQYPTLMKALGKTVPEFVQGKALDVFY